MGFIGERTNRARPLGAIRISEARTLFDGMNPWELEQELYRAEREIVRQLKDTAPFIPTGIDLVDFLVDQLRFAEAGRAQAERRGLHGLPAREWVEYLSWPERSRLAKTRGLRCLLRQHPCEV